MDFKFPPSGGNEIHAFDDKGNIFHFHPAFFFADPEKRATGLVESQIPAIEKIGLAVGDLLSLEEPAAFFVDPKSRFVHLPMQN